uniref:Uncharacterized protein n=1 Tax=Rhizophora mucronata TaxID=61149 RepID=A0A2P2N5F4_RHIMU
MLILVCEMIFHIMFTNVF